MKLSSLTHFGFLINSVLDTGPVIELGFAEIHAAARAGQLVEHLATRLGKISNFWMLLGNADELKQVDLALGAAAVAVEGREAGVAGVRQNGLCLVLAIILEAIQQQFRGCASPFEPEYLAFSDRLNPLDRN